MTPRFNSYVVLAALVAWTLPAFADSRIQSAAPRDGASHDRVAIAPAGGVGQLTISPASLDFGFVYLALESAPRTVTLSNTGTASLDITALSNPGGFFARDGGSCPATVPFALGAGGSCTLDYVFFAGSIGPNASIVTVAASAPGGGTITLTGQASQRTLTIAPTTVDFGAQEIGSSSPPATVTLGVLGPGSVDVIPGALAAPFARSGGTCPTTPTFDLVNPASCTLEFVFAPTVTGAVSQSQAITVFSAAGSGTITLTGIGVAAPSTGTPTAIPTLGPSALALLALVLGLIAWRGSRVN